MTDEPSPGGAHAPESPPEDARAPEGVDAAPSPGPRRWLRRSLGWLRRNAYLALAAGAVLVVTEAVEFSPPPEVRVGEGDVAQLMGDATPQEFSTDLANPQAVQLRATLRLHPDNEQPVGAPDPDVDAQSKLLSQPVVTTLLGMNATIDQTLRLDGGDLEVDLVLHATPRADMAARGKNTPPPLTLEHELTVQSRQHAWWRRAPRRRVHVRSRGMLGKVDIDGYRLVFTVDEHLFSLDLELHRAGTPLRDTETLAGGR